MTTDPQLEGKITQIVKRITFSDVTREQPLISSNLLDSIGVVDFLVEVEQAFGVTIDLQQVNEREFNTVEQIALKVAERLAT